MVENGCPDGPAGYEKGSRTVDGQNAVARDARELGGKVVAVEEVNDTNKTQIDGHIRPAVWHDPKACHERGVGQVVERRGKRVRNSDVMLVFDNGVESLVGHRALEKPSGSERLLTGEGRQRVGSREFDRVCGIDELLHEAVHGCVVEQQNNATD